MDAGTLTYNTNINTAGFQKGINEINSKAQAGGTKMKSIIGALGISKLISSAFHVISNSMGDAIGRLDALNNFPKVMSNLNISTKDSQKTIDTLSDKLRGLPTTLDAGALAVQRFTARNGDVKKSTDIFLALNNAILAGGASTEIQSSALEQLTQSYSKGKMDMMEWRTIQMAMPAQLKQVATTMGLTTDELGEMMREGDQTDETLNKFIETVIKLNKDGGKNFKSFEVQARNATDGIKTNVTNMRTAIARGVANILDGLDKALRKAKLGGLGATIKKVGNEAEKALTNIGKAVSKIDFNAIIRAIKIMIPLVGGLVTAFITYQSVLKAISAINMAKNIASMVTQFITLVPTINSTNLAMVALNGTMAISPIGVAVAGVTALVGALILSRKALAEEETQVEKNNQKLNAYKNEMQELEKGRKEYLKTNLSEVQNYQNLANELENLVDENGKVKSGYEERAKYIVTTLNDALGTEMSLNKGVLQGYKDMKNSIDDLIESKRAKVILDSHEAEYKKAIENESELLKELNSATKEQKDAQEKLSEWVAQTANHYHLTNDEMLELLNTNSILNKDLPISGNELMALKGKYQNLNLSIDQTNKSLSDSKQVYDDNQLKIIDYELALQGFSDKNYDVVSKIYSDTINYHGKTNADNYAKYQESINTMTDYLNRLKENRNNYSKEEYNALVSAGQAKLDELKKQQAQFKTITQEGQNSQTEITKKGQTQVKDIWKMSTGELINYLKGKKFEFRKTSDGYIQAFVDGQVSGEPRTRKEAKKMMKNIKSEIDKAKKYGYQGGFDLTSGTNGGIERGQGATYSVVRKYGNNILAELRKSLLEHSPSKASREMGQFLVKGFELGVEDEENKAYKQIDNFGNEIIDKMQNAVNLETGSMSFSGTTGTVNQILTANAQFEGTIPLRVDLDGEKIYDNQQKISARKSLQYGGIK